MTGNSADSPSPGGRLATYRQAVDRLSAHQKTAKGAPAYSRYVNRPIGRHLAALGHAFGATPNQVTALSALCSFSALLTVGLRPPSVPLSLLICGLLVLGYALDSADGQLARLRGGGSPAGEWLDHVIDAAKTVTLHAVVLLSFYRFESAPDAVLAVPLLYLCVSSTWFFTVILTDLLRRSHASGPRPTVSAPLWRSLAALPTDYGLTCLLFLLLDAHSVFLTGYTLMLLGTSVFFAAALRSWFRELSAFGRPAAPA